MLPSSRQRALLAVSCLLAAVASAQPRDGGASPPRDGGSPGAAEAEAARVDDAKDHAAGKPKRPERDANTCATCHLTLSEPKLRLAAEQFAHSVHRDERIGCVACHKGNPLDPTVQAHDKSTAFVVRPSHQQLAQLCGGCHEDPTFVRRFNARLPVDQKRLFELSRHGKIAAAGDEHSPTCGDCHGTHDVQSVASPTALANRRHVVELCSRCHGDAEAMKPYGLAANQPDKWKKSVHGKAFAAGNERAPACTGCHSPHAGTLPGTATVAALCDRCHQDERELFLKSPHARAFRKLGLADCVPCHGDHDVTTTSWLVGMTPDSACSKCHSQDEKPRQVAEQVATMLSGVDVEEHEVKVAIDDARKRGLFMPSAQYAVDRLRTSRLRLIATVHTLDLERLNADVTAAKAIAAEARGLVDQAEKARAVERRGYFAASVVAFVLFILLTLKAAQVARRRARGGP